MEKEKLNQHLSKYGWAKAEHSFDFEEEMDELIRRKNDYLAWSFYHVEKAFNKTLLPFNEENIEYIELARQIAKAYIRFDPYTRLLVKNVWQSVKENFYFASGIKYTSIPYSVIHLPDDLGERGVMHKDGVEDDFYTVWVPFNDCSHGPLAILEKTHRDSYFLMRLRWKFKFIDKLVTLIKKEVKPTLELGEYFIWHGKTEHQGVLNQTTDTKVAVNFRLTVRPTKFENIPIEDLENYQFKESVSVDFIPKIIKCFQEATKTNVTEVQKQVESWNLTSEEAKLLGHVFAIYAPRMQAKKDVIVQYLYAYCVDNSNLYAKGKVMSYINK